MNAANLPSVYNHQGQMVRKLVSFVLAGTMASGALFAGYDSVSGMAASCILASVMLIFLTQLAPPAARTVRAIGPVIALSVAAITWAAAATFIGNGHWPNFATPRLLSLFSGFAALLCGALFARSWGHSGSRTLLDTLLILYCATFVAGLTMRAVGTDGLFEYWTVERQGRFIGTIGNANVTAAIAGAFTVYALWRFSHIVVRSKRNERGAMIAASGFLLAFAITCGVLITSASRFTTVLTAVALIIVLLLERRGVKFRLASGFLALAGILAVMGIVLVTLYSGTLTERLEWLGKSWGERTELWGHYFSVALHQPLWGYGLGTFPEVNAHFLDSPRFAERAWAVNSAHNIIVQVMLVGGLPYLGLLTATSAVFMASIARTFRHHWTAERRVIVAMMALIFGSAQVDITLDMPVTVTLFLLLGGLLLGEVRDGRETIIAGP